MGFKKKMLLVPSAYSHRAMEDIENFIPYYKDKFELFVLTDERLKEDDKPRREIIVDGVHYVRKGAPQAFYHVVTADYIIDSGTVSGSTKYYSQQKRISVWHGVPYKKMFVDLNKEHIVTALDYIHGIDLMVSPSQWYTENFLRRSMLYEGEVLETAVARTDALFISEKEKELIRAELGIPQDSKVLLYAPTFRQRGLFSLPFTPEKVLNTLGKNWVIVTKLHYLNSLDKGSNIIDATEYPYVNRLLSIADLLITDYSSLLFDYSILGKPALLYQYDREEYEAARGFMFDMEDYVDETGFAYNEDDLYAKLNNIATAGANLEKVRVEFYPHQVKDATQGLVKKLSLDSQEREIEEIIFLVNELNQIGGVHTFVLNLAKVFKDAFNSRIIVIGAKEFPSSNEGIHLFDSDIIDIKLSGENDAKAADSILRNTKGYVITCQYSAQLRFQKQLRRKKCVLMFHGDTKDIVNRTLYAVHLDSYNQGRVRNYRRLAFLSKGNLDVISSFLEEDVRSKAIYIENSLDFSDKKNLYKESGDFALVSRLDPDKNPLDAIEIFATNTINPEYRLHIYGDGSLKQEVERLIRQKDLQDRIILHGFVANKEEIYRDKQGTLLTSLSEGMPLTLIESIKYGVPVYTYDSFTACRDMITSKTGVLVKTGNIEEYVNALNNPFNMDNFDNTEAQLTFSNAAAVKKWKKVFEELDAEVAVEEEESEKARNSQKNNVSGPKKKKRKKKKPLGRRIKDSVRNSSLFRENEKYAELSAAWRKVKHFRNNKSLPLVSIIMPFYNKNETVFQAVRSVVKNGYSQFEVILVNDGSDEDPSAIIAKYKKWVRYYWKENGGPGSARNFGLDRANGEYVLFLDPDDTLYPGALSSLVSFAEKNSLDAVSGKTIRYYQDKGTHETWYAGIYSHSHINTQSIRYRLIDDNISTSKLYRLEALNRAGIRFEKGLYEDVPFMARVYASFEEVGVIKKRCQKWIVYGSATSISTTLSYQSTVERIEKVNSEFGCQPAILKVYYTRQFIRHYLVVCLNWFNTYSESEKQDLFSLLRSSLLEREKYIVEKMIAMPSKVELYKSILENDYDRFCLIAEGFSAKYLNFYSNN